MALLRESGRQSGEAHNLSAVLDGSPISSLPHAEQLLAFADSALGTDIALLKRCRNELTAAVGAAAVGDAAAVIAAFNGITRIADATGIPLEDAKAASTADFRTELSIDDFQRG